MDGGSLREAVGGQEVVESSVLGGSSPMVPLKGCLLRITEDMVFLDCQDAGALFDQAEELEETKVPPCRGCLILLYMIS